LRQKRGKDTAGKKRQKKGKQKKGDGIKKRGKKKKNSGLVYISLCVRVTRADSSLPLMADKTITSFRGYLT